MNRRNAVLIATLGLALLIIFLQLRAGIGQRDLHETEEQGAIPKGRPIVLPNMPDPYGDEGFCEATPWQAGEPAYYPVPIGTSFYGKLLSAKVLKSCDIQLVFYTGGRFMARGGEGELEGMPYSAVNLYFGERALVYELRLDRWYYVEVNRTGYPVVLRPVSEREVRGAEEIR